MPLVRDLVAQFIQSEGHKVDVAPVDDEAGITEILFRTRGQVFSVTTYENDPGTYMISTAYEVPDWARERAENENVETLQRVNEDFPEITFIMAHDGGLFVATAEEDPGSPEAFTHMFWETVARVREAGAAAIERIVDRTESKAAAEKFINSFMTGGGNQ